TNLGPCCFYEARRITKISTDCKVNGRYNEEGFIRSATKRQEPESVQSRALRIKPIERNRVPMGIEWVRWRKTKKGRNIRTGQDGGRQWSLGVPTNLPPKIRPSGHPSCVWTDL